MSTTTNDAPGHVPDAPVPPELSALGVIYAGAPTIDLNALWREMADREKAAPAPKPAPAVPLFPTYGLPAAFVQFCRQAAKVHKVPDELIYISALTIAGAAAGAKVTSVIDGKENCPALYTMIIAESGAGKSAPLSSLMKPLQAIDRQLLSDYTNKYELWQTAQRAARKKDPTPLKPKKTQIVCAAKTDAARFAFVCDNPRGGICFIDELSGFFKGLCAKFNESAASDFLTIYNNEPIKVDTRGQDIVLRADKPFLAILGTIQPKTLKRVIKDDFKDSGLFARFLAFSFNISELPDTSSLDEEQKAFWADVVNNIHCIGSEPTTYGPSAEAIDVLTEKEREFRERFKSLKGYERDVYPKARYMVHRFALISHLLKVALGEASAEIGPETIRWAYDCVPFLIWQQLKAYNVTEEDAKRTDEEIVQDFAALCRRKGKTPGPSEIARVVGIARPTISTYINRLNKEV